MGQTSDDPSGSERLVKASDPDEFIKLFRAMVAEDNQFPEKNIFPMNEDSAGDLLYTLFGVWLAMCAQPPLASREAVVAAMDRMASLLKAMENSWPADEEQLKRAVLHCMRRGVTPNYWPRVN